MYGVDRGWGGKFDSFPKTNAKIYYLAFYPLTISFARSALRLNFILYYKTDARQT